MKIYVTHLEESLRRYLFMFAESGNLLVLSVAPVSVLNIPSASPFNSSDHGQTKKKGA